MAEVRDAILMCVCGRKKVGKTFTTIKKLRSYVLGSPGAGVPGRKILIFDANNEYSDKAVYPDIRRINLRDVPLFAAQPRAEIRRIAPFFDDNSPMTLDDMSTVLSWLVTVFKKGLLLIEDINKYVADNMPGDIIGALCTQRHNETDIIIHYQSFGRLNPKVWQNINVMRMHKNTDSVDRHENKFPDKWELMKIAENIVSARHKKGDVRFFLYIDFDDEKIFADEDFPFQPKEIEEAIFEFISENHKEVIGPMIERIDRKGKKVYTPETAIKAAETRLLKDYFDL